MTTYDPQNPDRSASNPRRERWAIRLVWPLAACIAILFTGWLPTWAIALDLFLIVLLACAITLIMIWPALTTDRDGPGQPGDPGRKVTPR